MEVETSLVIKMIYIHIIFVFVLYLMDEVHTKNIGTDEEMLVGIFNRVAI